VVVESYSADATAATMMKPVRTPCSLLAGCGRAGLDNIARVAKFLSLIIFGDIFKVVLIMDVGVARGHSGILESCSEEKNVVHGNNETA